MREFAHRWPRAANGGYSSLVEHTPQLSGHPSTPPSIRPNGGVGSGRALRSRRPVRPGWIIYRVPDLRRKKFAIFIYRRRKTARRFAVVHDGGRDGNASGRPHYLFNPTNRATRDGVYPGGLVSCSVAPTDRSQTETQTRGGKRFGT